jgi:hypothetical protein
MLSRAGKTGAWRDAFVMAGFSMAKGIQREMRLAETGVRRPDLDVDASVTRG